MQPKHNESYSSESFIWRGICCILTYFLLKFQFAKDIFGPYILVAGMVNAGAGWVFFIIGGYKSLRVLARVAKAVEEIKKGEEEGEEKED